MIYIVSLDCKLGLIPIWCGSCKCAVACKAIAYILKTCSPIPWIFRHTLGQHHASRYLNSWRLKVISRYHVIGWLLSLWVNFSQQHRGTVSNLNTFWCSKNLFSIWKDKSNCANHNCSGHQNLSDEYIWHSQRLICIIHGQLIDMSALCTLGKLYIYGLYLYIVFTGARPNELVS